MKVAKEASPIEQPPLPQAPVGGASPMPEEPAPDPNAGGEFDDGDDMGGEIPPMGNPQGGEGMEQPMGDDMGTQEDSKLQVVKDIWSQLSDEDKDAGIKYLESMKDDKSQSEGGEPMPPMENNQEPMPMQEKVIFKKKQLEELMRRK